MLNPLMRAPYANGVPNTFSPTEIEGETPITPASAGYVHPMRNGAPSELDQTGRALSDAGSLESRLGNTIGDRVQETMDDAATKSAENQFLQASLPLLSKYSATEGINATQQYEPTAQAIVKARQDARATLTNPIQQQMFDQVTNDHVLTFGAQMASHENTQRIQYAKNNAKARAANLNVLSTTDVAGRNRANSNYAKYSAQSDAEVLQYAELAGMAPDSPQAQELLRQNRTERDQSIVTSLLDQHAYNEASDFYNEHKGEMDIRAAEVLGNAVKSASDAEQVTSFRNQAIQSLHKTDGAGPLSQPIPAGTISTTAPDPVAEGALDPYQNPEDQPRSVSFSFNRKWAKPGPYITKLTPRQEQEFQKWAAAHPKAMEGETGPHADYDFRGFWLAKQQGDPIAVQASNGHWPDKWKTPYDATFSNQSQYALPNAPHWEGDKLVTAKGKLVTDESPAGTYGIDIHTVPGTKVHAPANGTVSKVWDDPKLGLSAQISLPNGYTAIFSHLSAVNYKQGQKITQGQVLGLSGKDATGQGVMHYAMTDPSGAYIDPRQAVSAPYDPKNFSSPQDEEKAVNWITSHVSDPVMQREAIAQVRSLASMNRGIENQQHAEAVKQATNYSLAHNGSLAGLPVQVKMQLTPQDYEDFAAKNLQQYRLGQAEKDRNEVPLLAQWYSNPATMTVDAVRQAHAQGKISDSTYLVAIRQAERLQGADGPGSTDAEKVRNATLDHGQLTDVLSLNNLPNLAHPRASDKNYVAEQRERAALETAVRNEIQLQQDHLKRPLTWQEKGKIMRDMVIDKVYTSGSTGGLIPFASATPQQQQNAVVWVKGVKVRMSDIPPKYAYAATEDLQQHGLPTTQANIAAWWIHSGEPKQ